MVLQRYKEKIAWIDGGYTGKYKKLIEQNYIEKEIEWDWKLSTSIFF